MRGNWKALEWCLGGQDSTWALQVARWPAGQMAREWIMLPNARGHSLLLKPNTTSGQDPSDASSGWAALSSLFAFAVTLGKPHRLPLCLLCPHRALSQVRPALAVYSVIVRQEFQIQEGKRQPSRNWQYWLLLGQFYRSHWLTLKV